MTGEMRAAVMLARAVRACPIIRTAEVELVGGGRATIETVRVTVYAEDGEIAVRGDIGTLATADPNGDPLE